MLTLIVIFVAVPVIGIAVRCCWKTRGESEEVPDSFGEWFEEFYNE
jgi:heme/copper-type cytochrome/quinol oxidase subunit 2